MRVHQETATGTTMRRNCPALFNEPQKPEMLCVSSHCFGGKTSERYIGEVATADCGKKTGPSRCEDTRISQCFGTAAKSRALARRAFVVPIQGFDGLLRIGQLAPRPGLLRHATPPSAAPAAGARCRSCGSMPERKRPPGGNTGRPSTLLIVRGWWSGGLTGRPSPSAGS